jgi:hypothetical protein
MDRGCRRDGEHDPAHWAPASWRSHSRRTSLPRFQRAAGAWPHGAEYDGPVPRLLFGRGRFEPLRSRRRQRCRWKVLGADTDALTLVADARGGDETALNTLGPSGSSARAWQAREHLVPARRHRWGFGEARPHARAGTRDHCARRVASGRDRVRVVPTALGEQVGMVGAD